MTTDELQQGLRLAFGTASQSLAALARVTPRDWTGQALAIGVLRTDLRHCQLAAQAVMRRLVGACELLGMANDVLDQVAVAQSSGLLDGGEYDELLLAAQALETAREIDGVDDANTDGASVPCSRPR